MQPCWTWSNLKTRFFMISWKGQGNKPLVARYLLSQVISQVQDLITMGFLAAGLVVFNPWLILLLFIAVLPAFIGESYFNDKNYSLSRRQTPERRELDYIRYIGASDETAKEVKLFNLSGFLIDRFRHLSNKFYLDNKKLAIKRSAMGYAFFVDWYIGLLWRLCIILFRKRYREGSRLVISHFWPVLSGSCEH